MHHTLNIHYIYTLYIYKYIIYIYIYSGVRINKTIYFIASSLTYAYDHQANKE